MFLDDLASFHHVFITLVWPHFFEGPKTAVVETLKDMCTVRWIAEHNNIMGVGIVKEQKGKVWGVSIEQQESILTNHFFFCDSVKTLEPC